MSTEPPGACGSRGSGAAQACLFPSSAWWGRAVAGLGSAHLHWDAKWRLDLFLVPCLERCPDLSAHYSGSGSPGAQRVGIGFESSQPLLSGQPSYPLPLTSAFTVLTGERPGLCVDTCFGSKSRQFASEPAPDSWLQALSGYPQAPAEPGRTSV